MAGMCNMILQPAPSALFCPLMAILAPYVGHPVNAVICTVANRGEAEAVEGVRSTTQRGKGDPLGSPAPKYGLTIMLAAVADREKLDGKSNKILLELRPQLEPAQQFRSLKGKGKPSAKAFPPSAWCPGGLPAGLPCPKPSASRVVEADECGSFTVTREEAAGPAWWGKVGTRGLMYDWLLTGPPPTCCDPCPCGHWCRVSPPAQEPQTLPQPSAVIAGYGGQSIQVKEVCLALGIGHLPHSSMQFTSPQYQSTFEGWTCCRDCGCTPQSGNSACGYA